MGFYKYVKQAFQQSYKERSPAMRARLTQWRKMAVVERTEKPMNIARARELGYKAKKEFIVARVRMSKGKRRRRKPDLGRKPGRRVKRMQPGISLQKIAEQKTKRKFVNLRVIGSYFVGEDGVDKYFEVILFNPNPMKPQKLFIKKFHQKLPA